MTDSVRQGDRHIELDSQSVGWMDSESDSQSVSLISELLLTKN